MKGIYAITPDTPLKLNQIDNILAQGVCALQYRRKNINDQNAKHEAKAIQALCHQYQTPLIINDDINLCLAINADGVHLGQSDTQLITARKLLGKDKIIGISCYDQPKLALEAQTNGANYVAFGALFSSITKPDAVQCPLTIIQQIKKQIKIPIIGIGGITHKNKQQAYQAGCDAVAMIKGCFL